MLSKSEKKVISNYMKGSNERKGVLKKKVDCYEETILYMMELNAFVVEIANYLQEIDSEIAKANSSTVLTYVQRFVRERKKKKTSIQERVKVQGKLEPNSSENLKEEEKEEEYGFIKINETVIPKRMKQLSEGESPNER